MQRARHSFLGDQWINQNKQIAVWCEQGWWKQAICGYPACQDLFFSFQWPHISLFQVLAVCALSIPSAQLKRCSHLIVVAIKSNCFCYQQRKELKTRLHEWWWSKRKLTLSKQSAFLLRWSPGLQSTSPAHQLANFRKAKAKFKCHGSLTLN